MPRFILPKIIEPSQNTYQKKSGATKSFVLRYSSIRSRTTKSERKAVEEHDFVNTIFTNPHFSPPSYVYCCFFSISPVPPSTTPSCLSTFKNVPKKQRQSNGKLSRSTYSPSSFAFIAPILLASKQWGLEGTLSGFAGVALVYFVASALIKWRGTDFLSRLFPPVVVGPVIILIGLSLSGTAVDMR